MSSPHMFASSFRVLIVLPFLACSDSPTTPRVGPPAQVDIVSGEGQAAVAGTELPNALVVKVLDQAGRPVPNQLVNFRVVAGGGSVFGGAALTNEAGIVQERWTLGTVANAEQIAEARAVNQATGAAIVFAVFHATANSGPASSIVVVAGEDQSATVGSALPVVPTVRVVDAHGNAVADVHVAFEIGAGGGAIPGGSFVSGEDGLASSGTWTLGTTPGANTLTASAPGLAPRTFTATGVVGTPDRLVKIDGDAQTGTVGAPVTVQPSVRLEDRFANPIVSATVSFFSVAGGGSVGATAITNSNGVAVAPAWTLGTVSGTNTISATAAGVASVTFNAEARPGSPASVTRLAGDGQQVFVGAPVPILPSVRVTDIYGNNVPGVTVTFAVSAGGGTASGLTPLTDANGIATVGGWILGMSAVPQTLSATSGTASTTFSATAKPNTASRMVANWSPSPTAGGATIRPSVLVTNEFGDPIEGVTVTFAPLQGTVSGGVVATNAAGISTVGGWTLANAATLQRLIASSPGLPDVTFTIAAGAGIPYSLSAQSLATPSSKFCVGEFLGHITVRLTDAWGQPVSGVPVTYTTTIGGPRVYNSPPEPILTGQSGTHLGSWAAGWVAGPQRLEISAGGLTTELSITVGPAEPTRIVKIAGDDQTAPVGTSLPLRPSVRVEDAFGNPTSHYTDTFCRPIGLIGLTFTGINGGTGSETIFAGAGGIATASKWVLGQLPGLYTVQASASLIPQPAVFTSQATPSVSPP